MKLPPCLEKDENGIRVRTSYVKALIDFATVVAEKLKEETNFTGKIVYTINCKDGGIGNTEAFIQRKIKNT